MPTLRGFLARLLRRHVPARAKAAKLETTIANLDAAIVRTEDRLHAMHSTWVHEGGFCPGCRFGYDWFDTYKKLKRQIEWRQVLEARRVHANGRQGPVPKITSDYL
jgi:hypothetical protein